MRFKKMKNKAKGILWYIGAILISLTTVYPFLWMIATSFKPEAEIYQKSLSLFPVIFPGIIIERYLRQCLLEDIF